MAARNRIRQNTAKDAPEFRAIHRFAKIAPRKARLVMDQVRGMPVGRALEQLGAMPQRGAFLIDKLLKSAVDNANYAIENELVRDSIGAVISPQPDLDVDELYIHDARVDEGPLHKRWRPCSRGAAHPYRKYFSHLSIRLRPMPGKRG